jgi:DNA-directed RNA polymerase specialized sigma24 family protein
MAAKALENAIEFNYDDLAQEIMHKIWRKIQRFLTLFFNVSLPYSSQTI